MADKPSRALVVYGYGLAPFINPSHTHIHTIALQGCCGFLSLDNFNRSGDEDKMLVQELAQILDAREAISETEAQHNTQSESNTLVQSISERFMGMKAAIVTNSSTVRSFGEKLGFTSLEFDKFRSDADFAASEILKSLGFENGQTLDSNKFDLVLLHIGTLEMAQGNMGGSTSHDVDFMNNLLGVILQTTQSGMEVNSRLHLSLVMSYGSVSEDHPDLSLSSIHDNSSSCSFSMIFPRQSYFVKGGSLRTDIRQHCPALVAQWQEAVTRKDMATMFSFDDFKRHSANLVIPADRILYEIAFKLWKAPKYGA